MKRIGTEWWVEYNFENEIAMNIRTFKDRDEAIIFAEEHDSKVIETKVYKC